MMVGGIYRLPAGRLLRNMCASAHVRSSDPFELPFTSSRTGAGTYEYLCVPCDVYSQLRLMSYTHLGMCFVRCCGCTGAQAQVSRVPNNLIRSTPEAFSTPDACRKLARNSMSHISLRCSGSPLPQTEVHTYDVRLHVSET